jgi:hypothetical protein
MGFKYVYYDSSVNYIRVRVPGKKTINFSLSNESKGTVLLKALNARDSIINRRNK